MSDVDLVGLYWTVSGPVEVHVGREWSLFDFRDRCAQAQRVGFSGIGIWHADLEHVLERRTLREMRQILDDHGLRHLELEFLMDWFLDADDDRRQASGTSPARRVHCRSSPSASRSSAPTRRSSTMR
jgi:sugar phosphate isomerase/epimerase